MVTTEIRWNFIFFGQNGVCVLYTGKNLILLYGDVFITCTGRQLTKIIHMQDHINATGNEVF